MKFARESLFVMRDALLTLVRRFPRATNVTLYGCLLVHQCLSSKEQVDWTHTRNVAVVVFGFHGNLNFIWMRFLERRFLPNPGTRCRCCAAQTCDGPDARGAARYQRLLHRFEFYGGQRRYSTRLEGEISQHIQSS